MMKRWLAAFIFLFCITVSARADAEISVQAKAAILIEAQSGRVLFEQNADERLPVASTTKIMTALIAVEHCGMDEMVTAGKMPAAWREPPSIWAKGSSLPCIRCCRG